MEGIDWQANFEKKYRGEASSQVFCFTETRRSTAGYGVSSESTFLELSVAPLPTAETELSVAPLPTTETL